jgi:hypothetical protein
MSVSESSRARAWVLFQVDDPQEVAGRIYEKYGYEGVGQEPDHWVVVRADVVEGSHNIVVPVDAPNDSSLEEVIAELAQEAGGDEPVVLKVEHHNPEAPHAAHGYITQKELDEGGDEDGYIKPGRQVMQSPGDNAWG